MTYANIVTTFDYMPDWPNISATPKEKIKSSFPIPSVKSFSHDGLVVITIDPPIERHTEEVIEAMVSSNSV